MVMVMGTSTCHMLLADRHAAGRGHRRRRARRDRRGLLRLRGGAARGRRHLRLVREARRAAGDFAALEREAAECPPGGRGLLALDWWNGNRSVLVDANLSGLIVGLTLSTTAPRDLPRADRGDGVLDAADPGRVRGEADPGRRADRGRRPRRAQPPAPPDLRRRHAAPDRARRHRQRLGPRRGDARRGRGGRRAGRPRVLRGRGARHGAPGAGARIEPDPGAAAAYDALYRDWLELHDHFGRGGTDVMARLRRGRG